MPRRRASSTKRWSVMSSSASATRRTRSAPNARASRSCSSSTTMSFASGGEALARGDEALEDLARGAVVDGASRERDALADALRQTGDVARRPRVQQDRRARSVLRAVEDAARHRGVPRRCTAGDLLTRRRRKTELRRAEPARAHLASADLPGARRGGRADLVEAVLAMDDKRVVGAELREHARDLVAERR